MEELTIDKFLERKVETGFAYLTPEQVKEVQNEKAIERFVYENFTIPIEGLYSGDSKNSIVIKTRNANNKIITKPRFSGVYQMHHTPEPIGIKMVSKIRSPNGKKIHVPVCPEFLVYLMKIGVDLMSGNVYFWSDREEKAEIALKLLPEKCIIDDDFLNPQKQENMNITPDVIIMNPPFHKVSKGGNGGRDLWNEFVSRALAMLAKDGCLLCIHPPKWRRPEHELWNKLSSMDMEYLEIHDKKDGAKVFIDATTRFDWYALYIKKAYRKTKVISEDGTEYKLKLSEMDFLPSNKIDVVMSIVAKNKEERCDVIYSRTSYGNDKPHMSQEKNINNKYPCVKSITKSGINFMWSSTKSKGHFGVRKVIINIAENPYAFFDSKGEYGLGNNVFGLGVKSDEEALKIVSAINSEKFMNDILMSTKWGNYQIDYRMFKFFKRDFWEKYT